MAIGLGIPQGLLSTLGRGRLVLHAQRSHSLSCCSSMLPGKVGIPNEQLSLAAPTYPLEVQGPFYMRGLKPERPLTEREPRPAFFFSFAK